MNELSPTNESRTGTGDDLDRLLSEFFKAQMKQPWPPAPVAGTAEPSTLAAARVRTPAATRDSGTRARYTLAASVALLLGTCWYLSNGFEPGAHPAGNSTTSNPGAIDTKKVTAGDPAALTELNQDRTKNGTGGFVPPKVKMP